MPCIQFVTATINNLCQSIMEVFQNPRNRCPWLSLFLLHPLSRQEVDDVIKRNLHTWKLVVHWFRWITVSISAVIVMDLSGGFCTIIAEGLNLTVECRRTFLTYLKFRALWSKSFALYYKQSVTH